MLSEQEQNVIKDILKTVANDPKLTNRLSAACDMTPKLFDEVTESIFNKCQNGRVIVTE